MSRQRDLLVAEKAHLGRLLEAVQRCVYFLDAARSKLPWPLIGDALERRKKDDALFESLSAFNERFAKLQDTLAAAMRHACVLSGEPADSFLKVLAYFEKQGVVGSIEDWQVLRTARNLAAHDYETDYASIAEHFNALHGLLGTLYSTASAFVALCDSQLGVLPNGRDFETEFEAITHASEP